MEFFKKARAVRLKSHLNKYLIADEDEESVRQSRNGATKKARWLVEFVEVNPHLIRLKSCYGKYLCASDESFLLGMTGKKVVQHLPLPKGNTTIEWEPIKEGYQIRLRTKGGGLLRANGATPPWRNSVTHDLPQRTATQDWVMWHVEVVDISVFDSVEYLSSRDDSSFSSLNNDDNSSSIAHSHSMQEQNHSLSMNSESCSSSSPVVANRAWLSMRLQGSINSRSLPGSPRQGVSGMEFFERAKSVRLQSHIGKYLVADDDEETVRQSRNGSSQRTRWTVEFVEGKNNLIRLKSCHGLYLSATDEAYLLGMTGKKVGQKLPSNKKDPSIEWEPIKEGFHVKLRTSEGKFLRANGATPPWRNSITHDIPHRTATQEWILWGVDIVDINVDVVSDAESVVSDVLSPISSSSPCHDNNNSGWSDEGSPSANLEKPVNTPRKLSPGIDFFKKAKAVKLKSHHNKYLIADDDQEKVMQERDGSRKNATWTVEFLDDFDNLIRLKSCFGKYLTATDEQFLLGVTGRIVKQTMPRKPHSSVEWEPFRDGVQVKLKTRYGNYLRANGGVPPWRNSVSHDIPHRHTDWILWDVEVVEVRHQEPPKKIQREEQDLDLSKFALRTPGFSSHASFDSQDGSPMKSDGRTVYYRVANEDGNVDNEFEESSFLFKGAGLEELTEALEEETGHENIIVCSRNKINGQLYPLRLSLPPNNATMHVVVVPSTSKS